MVEPDHRGLTWQARVSWFVRSHPVALQTFGHAVLSAYARAVASEVSVCKWCLASSTARARGQAEPSLGNAAHKSLLGTPCQRCLVQMRNAAVLKVDSVRRDAKAAKAQTASVSDPELEQIRRDIKHTLGKCGLCHMAHSGRANRATVEMAMKPHMATAHVKGFYIPNSNCCASCDEKQAAASNN